MLGIVLKSVYNNKLYIFIVNFMVLDRFFKTLQDFSKKMVAVKLKLGNSALGRVFIPSRKALRLLEHCSTVMDTQVLTNWSFLIFVFGSGNSNECLQNGGFEYTICFLPPLVLNFELPPDYPSSSPPSFTLSGKWLSPTQVRPTT